MRTKILAATLFFLICIIPGSKAGIFNGIPLSATEALIAFLVFLGIFTTSWDAHSLLKKSVFSTLSILLLAQFFSYKAIPYGWNVCVRSDASASELDSNCERSLEFRSGKQSFIYGEINLERNSFPLYFLNNTSSFNFYLPEQPKRSSLPFTLEASTYIFPEKGAQLTIQSEQNVKININGNEFVYDGNEKAESINLIPGTINHISLIYETNRNKRKLLIANLPKNHFFKAQETMSGILTVQVYQLSNSFFLILLVSFFGYGFLSLFRTFKKRDSITISLLTALTMTFCLLVWKEILDFHLSAVPFAIILASSSLYYTLSEHSTRKKILPFILLLFLAASCALTASQITPQQPVLFSGGNDEIGHESFARHTMLATTFKEFAAAAEPDRLYYYQPLYRYFLAALHSVFGEPMWGVYVAQTIFFSLAFLFSSVILFGSIGFAALAGFTGLSMLLISLPQTSILGIIQSPYQQSLGLPLLMVALVQIAFFARNPNRKWTAYFFWGIIIGATFMTRTDWLVTFSGIAICILFVLFSRLNSTERLKYITAIIIGLSIFPILVGMRNHYISGKFAIMPTSGFVNLINELAVPLREKIPLHENSASVFAKEISTLFEGRYSELLSILWNNVYKHIVDPTIVREGLWIIGVILVLISALFFSSKDKNTVTNYISLICFLASFLSLITVNSFFFQHNGMAMYGAYDFILLLILATGFQIISDRFGIAEYTKTKLNSYLGEIYTSIQSNDKLSAFLRSSIPKNASVLDKVKIAYRPYICPFDDLLKLIPNRASVFDIGCGSGMFLSLVSKFKNPKAIGGVEISQQLIDNARVILRNKDDNTRISLHTFNGVDIPDEVASYDYIFLIDVLHHVPKENQIKFLENLHEKMSPGSKLILKDIDGGRAILSKFNKLHDMLLSGEIGHEISSAYASKKLARIGFKISPTIKKRMFVYPHYTVVCEKI